MNLTPREIVKELDKYVIGQNDAKRAVAIALRNRYRRSRLTPELRDEITPKNIIMKGPTGVGKTEIARRLAKLVGAPFIKVEATKYTEVGYVGRDVESMVRDLVECSVRLVKEEHMNIVSSKAQATAERKVVDLLYSSKIQEKGEKPEELFRQELLTDFREGKYDNFQVELSVVDQPKQIDLMGGMGAEINIGSIFGDMLPKRTKLRRVGAREAYKYIHQEESNKLIDDDAVNQEAVRRAEQEGIIFIDEIDKIAAKANQGGADVSREGVQRDILPIVEGSTVITKYGPVKSDYILFIAAGAFHVSKIEDLIPELQGRFPIKVELSSLSKQDFINILTIPQNAITKQYKTLLLVDNIDLKFTSDAIEAIAEIAAEMNASSEDIGARRLHTVIENLLDDISFNAGGDMPLTTVTVDKAYVEEHLKTADSARNLKKYIL